MSNSFSSSPLRGLGALVLFTACTETGGERAAGNETAGVEQPQQTEAHDATRLASEDELAAEPRSNPSLSDSGSQNGSDPSSAVNPSAPSTAGPLPTAAAQQSEFGNEPSSVDNEGVWIYATGSAGNASEFNGAAHGLGSEWEYHPFALTGATAGICGTNDRDVWFVNALVVHFDGTRFSDPTSPWSSTGVDWGLEVGEASCDVSSVWAISAVDPTLGDALPLARWHDATWTAVPEVPRPLDVWAGGPNDVWVVSAAGLHHYDGSGWTVQPPKGGPVFGTASDDVWLGLGWHYDGESWEEVATPEGAPPLVRLWGTGPTDLWALDVASGTPKYHFDGESWTEVTGVPSVGGGGPFLGSDIFGRNESDIWVVGSEPKPPPVAQSELTSTVHGGRVLHYDGLAWTDVTPPLLRGSRPLRVWVAPNTGE